MYRGKDNIESPVNKHEMNEAEFFSKKVQRITTST